jgi:hypothetical protein
MNYTTKEINQQFIIKVYGRGLNTAVGCRGFYALLEDSPELAAKLVDKAMNCREDKIAFKLRRGVKITFYYH